MVGATIESIIESFLNSSLVQIERKLDFKLIKKSKNKSSQIHLLLKVYYEVGNMGY